MKKWLLKLKANTGTRIYTLLELNKAVGTLRHRNLIHYLSFLSFHEMFRTQPLATVVCIKNWDVQISLLCY